MNSRIFGLLAALLVGAGGATAQTYSPTPLPTSPASNAPPPTLNSPYPALPTLNSGPSGPGVMPAIGPVESGPVFYGSADYLLWHIRKGDLPTAMTTVPVGLISVDISDLFSANPSGSPSFPGASAVGFAPVSIVNQATFGAGTRSNIGSQNGGRFTLGFWLDEDMSYGMEAQFLFLERGSDDFAAVSSQQGNQFLVNTGFTRDLFVIGAGGTTTLLRTFDIFAVREATSSLVGNTSATLYGAEINARSTGIRVGGIDFAGLAGFRYLSFNDTLTVVNNLRLFRPIGLAPTSGDTSASLSQDLTFLTRDRTRVYNNFYGGQIGLDIDAKFGSFFINARLKAAFGNMHQVAQVDSRTTAINNDPQRPSPPSYGINGGLLASPADNGRHTRDVFAFLPEGNFKFGYQFADCLRGYIGYDVLSIGHTARAGNTTVINTLNTTVTVAGGTTNINLSQPSFRFNDQDTWIQGLTFGLEVKY